MSSFQIEPFPKNPNFEMQQKRARKLLRAAWDGDAAAIERIRAFLPRRTDTSPTDFGKLKLHDAQLVIARGYGFETWAALKRKIEALTKTPQERFDIAVRSGDAEAARDLLTAHADLRAQINAPRFDFDSPALHQAKHNLPLVDVLLEFGADINARSTFWAGSFGILEHALTLDQARPLIERGATITPWAAALFGMLDELKAHLAASPDLIGARGGDGKTLLHFASTPEIVEFLLDSGADPNITDIDHCSTSLQYLIGDEKLARLLIARGAKVDLFAAARLGDREQVERCLAINPSHGRLRTSNLPAPGMSIYCWTLGFDLTPASVARKFGHEDIARLLVSELPPKDRYLDALWCADEPRARAELAAHPDLKSDFEPHDWALITSAAWWYRPDAVRLMLQMGFSASTRGAHQSTVLDRASFHGYADIVEMVLEYPDPPLTERNEFGGQPLGACIYGSMNGWDTGHPRDHLRTLKLLIDAGAPLDPEMLPTGDDAIDTLLRDELRSQRKR